MTTIAETEATALLAQMRAAHLATARTPGEFTAAEYAQANEMKHSAAAGELEALEAEGVVTRRKVRQNVYYKFVV
jgi:DNA-binding transcriptional ArsR family regulator